MTNVADAKTYIDIEDPEDSDPEFNGSGHVDQLQVTGSVKMNRMRTKIENERKKGERAKAALSRLNVVSKKRQSEASEKLSEAASNAKRLKKDLECLRQRLKEEKGHAAEILKSPQKIHKDQIASKTTLLREATLQQSKLLKTIADLEKKQSLLQEKNVQLKLKNAELSSNLQSLRKGMNQDEDEKKKLKAQIASLEKQLKSKHDKQKGRSLEIAKLKVEQEKI